MSHDPSLIRSFALAGHGGSGKTHAADALARLTGLNSRLGSPADGTSLFDFEPEEQKRGGSITSHLLTCEHDGYRYHVIDTPGDGNFLHDARNSLQAVDSVVLVVSAVDGVEVSTERMSTAASELGLPQAVFINKMDRERADWQAVISEVRDVLGMEPVMLQIPIGSEDGFTGVVDLIERNAWMYSGDTGLCSKQAIPDELEGEMETALETLVESVAMADDNLVEKYLEDGELAEEDVRAGLNKGIKAGTLCPVIVGSAARNIGLDGLLRLAKAFPVPSTVSARAGTRAGSEDPVEIESDPGGPAAALCFKTVIDPFAGQISLFRVLRGTITSDSSLKNSRTSNNERLGTLFHLVGKKHSGTNGATVGEIFGVAKLRDTRTGDTLSDSKALVAVTQLEPLPPMISYTVTPRNRGDEDKVKGALLRILAEDGGLRQGFDEITKEIVVSGMGVNHIRLSLERMARKYGVAVDLGTPTIPYRETIASSADVRYRHKKQSGGAGQFGEVAIRVEPNPGGGFEFVNKIVGGVIPGQLIPSVEKGIRGVLKSGILAGFPVVDVRVELYDGKTHPVDSKDIAFQIAGRQAMKKGFMESRPVLLEPIYDMEIVVPEESVGDIMGDMNSRRGRIQTMETKGRNAVVKAQVPLAEILNYAPDLNSMTGGKGSYIMQLSSYDPVPAHLQDKVVAAINRTTEDDH